MSNYNGLLIFNYPMPTPCLAKDLKYNFLFLQNTSSNALKSICLKFLYVETKAWLCFPNARRFVIYI